MYILGGPGVGAKAGVRALKTAEVRVGVLLPLVQAFPASLYLLVGARIQRVYNLTISLKVNHKTSVLLSGLANLLGLKHLEL